MECVAPLVYTDQLIEASHISILPKVRIALLFPSIAQLIEQRTVELHCFGFVLVGCS